MKRIILVSLALVLSIVLYFGVQLGVEISKAMSEDPGVWAPEIAAFEEMDRRGPPPANAIVFVGSSSIRMWDTLAEDMAPLVVVRRGFGGAKVGDVVFYADRIVTPYDPRAVVVYVGGNDLRSIFGSEGKQPDQVVAGQRELARRIHASNPETPIYFVALKPTSLGGEHWELAQQANTLTARFAEEHPQIHFIDANGALLGKDGVVESRFLKFDGIHLSGEGYATWGPPIRARLLADLRSE